MVQTMILSMLPALLPSLTGTLNTAAQDLIKDLAVKAGASDSKWDDYAVKMLAGIFQVELDGEVPAVIGTPAGEMVNTLTGPVRGGIEYLVAKLKEMARDTSNPYDDVAVGMLAAVLGMELEG